MFQAILLQFLKFYYKRSVHWDSVRPTQPLSQRSANSRCGLNQPFLLSFCHMQANGSHIFKWLEKNQKKFDFFCIQKKLHKLHIPISTIVLLAPHHTHSFMYCLWLLWAQCSCCDRDYDHMVCKAADTTVFPQN